MGGGGFKILRGGSSSDGGAYGAVSRGIRPSSYGICGIVTFRVSIIIASASDGRICACDSVV